MKRKVRKGSGSDDTYEEKNTLKQGSLFSYLANDSDEFSIKANYKSLSRPKQPKKSKSDEFMFNDYHLEHKLYAKQSLFHEKLYSDEHHLREPSRLDLVYLHDYLPLERCFDSFEKWALTNDVTGLTDVEAAANYMAWQRSCLDQHEPEKKSSRNESSTNIQSDDWHTPYDISSEESSVPVVYEDSYVSSADCKQVAMCNDVTTQPYQDQDQGWNILPQKPASDPPTTHTRNLTPKLPEKQCSKYDPLVFILRLILYALAISSVTCMTCNTILPSLISLNDSFTQQLMDILIAITQMIAALLYSILIYINNNPFYPVNIFNNYITRYNDYVIRSDLANQNNCSLMVKFFNLIHLDVKQRLLGPNGATISPTPCRRQWWY